MNMHVDPRTSERRSLRLMVKSRVESRVVHVDLVDISERGCKLKGSPGFADVGDRVTMKIGGVHAPVGYIKWVRDRVAGVTFDGEIHEAVLDHLCALQDPKLSVDKDGSRRV